MRLRPFSFAVLLMLVVPASAAADIAIRAESSGALGARYVVDGDDTNDSLILDRKASNNKLIFDGQGEAVTNDAGGLCLIIEGGHQLECTLRDVIEVQFDNGANTFVVDDLGAVDKVVYAGGAGCDQVEAVPSNAASTAALTASPGLAPNGCTQQISAGGGADTVIFGGGAGATIAALGAGSDTINFANAAYPAGVNVTGDGANNDGDGNDGFSGVETFQLTSANDTFSGPSGTVEAGDGNDLITFSSQGVGKGGNGNDILNGGPNNDNLDGGADNDTIAGNAGNDTITPGSGSDISDGGPGSETITETDAQANTIRGGADDDTLNGGPGPDTIDGGSGDDTLKGNAGGDTLLGFDGDDTIEGSSGADTVDAGPGKDVVDGGADADSIVGGPGPDVLNGAGQNDTIDGGIGDDSIDPSEGNDTALGGPGDDTFLDSPGADTINGGEGSIDAFAYGTNAATPVSMTLDATANDGRAGEGDNLLDLETLTGGAGNDTLGGDGEPNYLNGAGGNDQINGAGGIDVLRGNDGNDTITARDATLTRDDVGCNEGADAAIVDAADLVASDCEATDRSALPPGVNLTTLGASGLETVGGAALAPGAPVGGSADTAPPKIQIRGLAGRVLRMQLRRGLRFRVSTNEPVSLGISLIGVATSAKIAAAGDLVLAERSLGRSGATRAIVLKPRPSLLGRKSTLRVKVRVRAVDAAGNATVITRTVKVGSTRR